MQGLRSQAATSVVLAVLASASLAGAQVRVVRPQTPSKSSAYEVIEQPAIAESLAILKQLQSSTGKNRRDAAAWFRQGQIAALLFERCLHRPPAVGLDCTRPRMLADSALLIARELEPTNREYILGLGRFLLATDATYYRDGTYFRRLFNDALRDAKRSGDPSIYAAAAIDLGRFFWLQYEATSHRGSDQADPYDVRMLAMRNRGDTSAFGRATTPRQLTREDLHTARSKLDGRLQPGGGFAGEIEYLLAEIAFREVFGVAPNDLRAYRSLAALLAERDRWGELGAVAAARTAALPTDGWAWMTRGLASYRQGDRKFAAVAFDSAYVLLGSDERARLDQIDRVLGSAGRRALSGADSATRAGSEKLFWLLNDPLWTVDDDQPRPEFLARVAYAELMWTGEERAQYGADSDRGAVYIKFGPPDRIWSYRCANDDHFKGMEGWLSGSGPRCGSRGKDTTSQNGAALHDPGWTEFQYDYSGLDFSFRRVLTYATMHLSTDSSYHADLPASFDNLIRGRIDSIPVQLARFRAGADSVDVVVATLPPIDAVTKSAAIAGPVRNDDWLLTMSADVAKRDSAKSGTPGVRMRQYRLQNGAYIYRTETTGEGSLVSGRATWAFVAQDDPRTGFSTHGFGMSDVLIASSATPKASAPARWNDFTILPIAGPVEQGAPISVLWETYNLSDDSGRARYGVRVAIWRPTSDTSTTPNIAARIVNGIAGAIGFTQKSAKDVTEFTFDRELPYRSALVDNVDLSLGTTPPGNYVLTLEITDRVTGKLLGRSQQLIIQPAAKR